MDRCRLAVLVAMVVMACSHGVNGVPIIYAPAAEQNGLQRQRLDLTFEPGVSGLDVMERFVAAAKLQKATYMSDVEVHVLLHDDDQRIDCVTVLFYLPNGMQPHFAPADDLTTRLSQTPAARSEPATFTNRFFQASEPVGRAKGRLWTSPTSCAPIERAITDEAHPHLVTAWIYFGQPKGPAY
jgi:hypothetical protein